MGDRPVVIVTGASRGIGAPAAVEFARRGYDVAVVARNEDDLNNTAARIRDVGGDALVIAGDLVDVAFGESTIDQTVERFGRVDTLVNNAAWRDIVSMRRITLESWEKTLRISLTTPAFMARRAAEHMKPGSSIINISSVQSQFSYGIAPAYIAAKGATDALIHEMANLYSPRGIRVVGLNPGAIDTEMSADYNDDTADINAEMRRFTEDVIPLKRWGQPGEIAKTIVWLASEDASYITGTSIVVDGGISRVLLPYSMKHKLMGEDYP